MRILVRLVVLLLTAVPGVVSAQTPPARLIVTVSDPTGGVLPGARVTVTALEPNATPKTIEATAQGVATVPDLAPGRYSIKAEFDGLDTLTLADVRLRAGDNRQSMVLPLPKMSDTVTVGVDRQAAAADRNRAFGSALTREQIESLSNDRVEMQRQLAEMAGVEAIIRVDTFEGADLPPKAQIKSIHITRDAFAAENHAAGGVFIDIVTQPGIGPLRGGFNTRLRAGGLSATSPFVTRKGPEQLQNYNVNIGGTIKPEVSSFSVNFSTNYAYDTPILRVALPNGSTVSETFGQRVPQNNFSVSALVDYALTKDQTLRFGVSGSRFTSDHLGVGAYDLPGRAFSADSSNFAVRVQETGPIGRRFFINTRVGVNYIQNSSRSDLEEITQIVNDAFTSGGQQRAGGRNIVGAYIASDLDYVRGIHSFRTGIQLSPEWYDSDERLNYLGTYTFESLDAYDAGTPKSYTRRIGDPHVSYFYMQGGAYVQDDIRVRRGLTLSPGLRVEGVTHVHQNLALSPRFGMTWAPFSSGRTTLRASTGIFYDWLPSNGYEQTLRIDGYRQREFNIVDPPYDPNGLTASAAGTVLPVNKFLLGDDLHFASFKRISTGIDQTINPRVRVSGTYAYMRASNRWRGDNLNAPINGVRPDSAFANVIESISDGRSVQHTLSGIFSLNLARMAGPAPAPVMVNGVAVNQTPARPAAPGRFDWRRMTVNGSYTFSQFDTNADANVEGIFATPASGSVAGEWGPSLSEVPHRINVGINSTALRNLNANFSFTAFSSTPYTIRTGLDDNGDLIFNDRPLGVGRNSARGEPQWSLNTSFTYTIPLGRGTVSLPPGVTVNAPGGGLPPQVSVSQQAASRYRLQLMLNIQNLTNHDNFVNYSGVMTSPFFGQPQSVANLRKIDIGIGMTF